MINFIQNSNDGFPKGFERSLNEKVYGFKIVQDPYPVRAGVFSKRFELRPGDCSSDEIWNDCETDRSRIEFKSIDKILIGDDKWIAWSVFLDDSFQDISPAKTTLGQITQPGGPVGEAGGFISMPPLIQFNIDHGQYVLVHHDLSGDKNNIKDDTKKFKLIDLQDMIGKWTDIVLHIRFEKETGYLEVFINGVSQVTIKGNLIRVEPKNFAFKYGIYNSFLSRYKNQIPTHIVYFDEIRTGKTRESVDLRYNPDLLPVD